MPLLAEPTAAAPTVAAQMLAARGADTTAPSRDQVAAFESLLRVTDALRHHWLEREMGQPQPAALGSC